MATKRRLTDFEIDFLRSIYGNEIAYRKVKVRKGNTFIFRNNVAFVIDYKIHFHKDDYRDDYTLPFGNNYVDFSLLSLFVHELCHVWQFDNLDYSFQDAMEEHILYGKKVYEYDIDVNKSLIDYRFEQQAEIIEDWFYYKLLNPDISRQLEKIIYKTIPKPTYTHPLNPEIPDKKQSIDELNLKVSNIKKPTKD